MGFKKTVCGVVAIVPGPQYVVKHAIMDFIIASRVGHICGFA